MHYGDPLFVTSQGARGGNMRISDVYDWKEF